MAEGPKPVLSKQSFTLTGPLRYIREVFRGAINMMCATLGLGLSSLGWFFIPEAVAIRPYVVGAGILALAIASYRAWKVENEAKEAAQAKLQRPDLQGTIKQFQVTPFDTLHSNEFGPLGFDWIAVVELDVTNHTPDTTTTLAEPTLTIFTDDGEQYLGTHVPGTGLGYFGGGISTSFEYQLSEKMLPENPLPGGYTCGIKHRGWLCFRLDAAHECERLKIINLSIVLIDGFDTPHKIKGSAPWVFSGMLTGKPLD